MEDFTEEAPDATLAGVMTTVMMLISFLFREEAVLKLRTNLRFENQKVKSVFRLIFYQLQWLGCQNFSTS